MRFVVARQLQFAEQAADDLFQHGVGALFVLRQQLRPRHFEVGDVDAGAVVGEELRPFAAQLARQVGGVKDETLARAQVDARLFFGELDDAAIAFLSVGSMRLARRMSSSDSTGNPARWRAM